MRAREQKGPWPKVREAITDCPEDLQGRYNDVYERGGEPTLDELVKDIQLGKGALSETELKLLFIHQITTQVQNVKKLRREGQ